MITPECPKCGSIDVFRAWNKSQRRDDGICRICFHKSDFEKFEKAGEATESWIGIREFNKEKYYAEKYGL